MKTNPGIEFDVFVSNVGVTHPSLIPLKKNKKTTVRQFTFI